MHIFDNKRDRNNKHISFNNLITDDDSAKRNLVVGEPFYAYPV